MGGWLAGGGQVLGELLQAEKHVVRHGKQEVAGQDPAEAEDPAAHRERHRQLPGEQREREFHTQEVDTTFENVSFLHISKVV